MAVRLSFWKKAVRRRQLAKDLDEAQAKVGEFERKFGRSLAQFEAEILPTAQDFDTHNDYNDWIYFSQIVERLSTALSGINGFASPEIV